MTVDWSRYRDEFPVTGHYLYMNHAAVSPLSTRVGRAMQTVSDGLAESGNLFGDELFARCEDVRASVGRLINVSPDEIAFTRNTTQGVLTAAMGVRWSEGDNVVMPSIEFPANVYPWMGLSRFGVSVKLVEPEDGRVTAGMLAEACDERTRLVTASLVQFSNGYRIDVDELGSYCRGNGIFLHIDGIQALGMIDLDLSKHGIDFLSAGGHKWLLSVPGVGLFYIRKELIAELHLWNPGWTGVVDPWNFLSYDPTYRDDARRYEEGSLNFHGIYALGASVDRFLEIGMSAVEERIISLTDLLQEKLEERGCGISSPRGPAERSGIICFKHPRRETEELFLSLSDAGAVVSMREGSIRVSPHFYNTEEEVERLCKLIG
jgi:cysteine desulfurase/selenocysteine lyase